MRLALPARAKLNLELNVLGRRPDGYHEVETTFEAISLHDTLVLAPAGQTTLEVSGFAVPEEGSNLVLAALARLEQVAGRALPTEVRLVKRIPPGAGFGGGSSDAAAALRALKRLHRLDAELEPLARELGSDVAFFLRGGRARARGRGEDLEPVLQRVAWYALAWPAFELSTERIYGSWDLTQGSLQEAAAAVEPRLGEFRERLGDNWFMTGTGSGFFRPVEDEAEARRAVGALGCWTAVAHSVPAWD